MYSFSPLVSRLMHEHTVASQSSRSLREFVCPLSFDPTHLQEIPQPLAAGFPTLNALLADTRAIQLSIHHARVPLAVSRHM
jgi:hypothetical protein